MQTALTSLKKKMKGTTTTTKTITNKVTPINGIELGVDIDQLMKANQKEIDDARRREQSIRHPSKQLSKSMSQNDLPEVTFRKDSANPRSDDTDK